MRSRHEEGVSVAILVGHTTQPERFVIIHPQPLAFPHPSTSVRTNLMSNFMFSRYGDLVRTNLTSNLMFKRSGKFAYDDVRKTRELGIRVAGVSNWVDG